jgi:hypothetical protein
MVAQTKTEIIHIATVKQEFDELVERVSSERPTTEH